MVVEQAEPSPDGHVGNDPGIVVPLTKVGAEPQTEQRTRARVHGPQPGVPVRGAELDRVFSGPGPNSRIGDLRARPAEVIDGRKVADAVYARSSPLSR